MIDPMHTDYLRALGVRVLIFAVAVMALALIATVCQAQTSAAPAAWFRGNLTGIGQHSPLRPGAITYVYFTRKLLDQRDHKVTLHWTAGPTPLNKLPVVYSRVVPHGLMVNATAIRFIVPVSPMNIHRARVSVSVTSRGGVFTTGREML